MFREACLPEHRVPPPAPTPHPRKSPLRHHPKRPRPPPAQPKKKPPRWGVIFARRLGVIIGCLLTLPGSKDGAWSTCGTPSLRRHPLSSSRMKTAFTVAARRFPASWRPRPAVSPTRRKLAARRHDPDPGNQIMWHGQTRLGSAAMGHLIGFKAGRRHALREKSGPSS